MKRLNRRISLLIPVYNEAFILHSLCEQLINLQRELILEFEFDLEVIFVDNRSTDGSDQILRQIISENLWMKTIQHQFNKGLQSSIRTGLAHSTGDAIVIYQSDMQDPIELITELVRAWNTGSKYVATKISKRNSGLLDSFSRSIGYLILRFFSRVQVVSNGTDFWLIDKELKNSVLASGNRRPFYRMDLRNIQEPEVVISYERVPRATGVSKFNFALKYEFFLDALLSDIRRFLINIIFLISFLVTLSTVLITLLSFFIIESSNTRVVLQFLLLICTLFFIGSVMAILVLILEMLQRIFKEPVKLNELLDLHILPDHKDKSCNQLRCYLQIN